MGATVDELLDALKPVLRNGWGDWSVCLVHPGLRPEELTFVELRSEHGAMIDLYSGTLETGLDATALSHRLHHYHTRKMGHFEVLIFHPDLGAMPLTDIEAENEEILLKTEASND
jgi:hypothetical protein